MFLFNGNNVYLQRIKMNDMNTVTINVESNSVFDSLKKILSLMDGVSIVNATETPKENCDITQTAGYREAIDDIQNGRVSESFCREEDVFNHLGI